MSAPPGRDLRKRDPPPPSQQMDLQSSGSHIWAQLEPLFTECNKIVRVLKKNSGAQVRGIGGVGEVGWEWGGLRWGWVR